MSSSSVSVHIGSEGTIVTASSTLDLLKAFGRTALCTWGGYRRQFTRLPSTLRQTHTATGLVSTNTCLAKTGDMNTTPAQLNTKTQTDNFRMPTQTHHELMLRMRLGAGLETESIQYDAQTDKYTYTCKHRSIYNLYIYIYMYIYMYICIYVYIYIYICVYMGLTSVWPLVFRHILMPASIWKSMYMQRRCSGILISIQP